jgi:hypothetical protein
MKITLTAFFILLAVVCLVFTVLSGVGLKPIFAGVGIICLIVAAYRVIPDANKTPGL